jgi:hypothetical protein
VLLGLLDLAVPAGADQGGVQGLRNVLDTVDPAIPGLTVQVISSASDQLVAQNTTPTPLTILAPTGEPFLQIGPQGVLANTNSPFWYQSNGPGGASIPPGVNPKGPARWARVSRDPNWGWFDPRLPQSAIIPQAAPGVVVPMSAWTIPMTYGDRPIVVHGHLQYQQPTGTLLARLVDPPPNSAGLALAVVPGGSTPALFASWTGPQPVTVLGQAGEPMVRFGPNGVEVNLASPTWAFSGRFQGQPPDGVVDASAPPRWKLVDPSPRLSWLEPRAQYSPGTPPSDVMQKQEPTDLVHWTIPLVIASQRVTVDGVTRWVPNQAAGSPSKVVQAAARPRHGSSGLSVPIIASMAAGGLALVGGAGFALTKLRPRARVA